MHFTEDISSSEMSANEVGYIAKDNLLNISIPRGQKHSVPITQIGLKINGQHLIYGLRFTYETGDVHTLFEADSGRWFDKAVPEEREIIGIYGQANEDRIKSLGFILWNPNPRAQNDGL